MITKGPVQRCDRNEDVRSLSTESGMQENAMQRGHRAAKSICKTKPNPSGLNLFKTRSLCRIKRLRCHLALHAVNQRCDRAQHAQQRLFPF
jgi:hypothetical protein